MDTTIDWLPKVLAAVAQFHTSRHVLRCFGFLVRVLNKASLGFVVIPWVGNFMSLVMVWQDFCTMNVKTTHDNVTTLPRGIEKVVVQAERLMEGYDSKLCSASMLQK